MSKSAFIISATRVPVPRAQARMWGKRTPKHVRVARKAGPCVTVELHSAHVSAYYLALRALYC